MGNFYCLAVGFFVAICLVLVLFSVKEKWEEHTAQMEEKMREIAREEFRKESNCVEMCLKFMERNDKRPELEKKEGENETD